MDSDYWNNRYLEKMVGWNAREVTTPIKAYADQLDDKEINILIPGAGYGHEAGYLISKGFKNTFICEWSSEAIDQMMEYYPTFPRTHIFNEDFFEHKGKYDLIIEQTFFCSFDPSKRLDYAVKIHDILKPKGKLVGLLFDFPLTEKGPPFGGDRDKYLSYFCEHFKILTLERSYNSIQPRAGNELFIIAEKQIR